MVKRKKKRPYVNLPEGLKVPVSLLAKWGGVTPGEYVLNCVMDFIASDCEYIEGVLGGETDERGDLGKLNDIDMQNLKKLIVVWKESIAESE